MEHDPQQLMTISRWAKTFAWLALILGISGTGLIGYTYFNVYGQNPQSILTDSKTLIKVLDAFMGSIEFLLVAFIIIFALLAASQLIPYMLNLLQRISRK